MSTTFIDPSDQDIRDYTTAEECFERGDTARASAILLDMVERGSTRWEPYNDLGVLAQSQGDLSTAIHFLRLAALREATPGTATGNLSQALMLAGKAADAMALWIDLLGEHSAAALGEEFANFVSHALAQPGLLPALFDALKQTWRCATPDTTPQESVAIPLLNSGTTEVPGFVAPLVHLAHIAEGREIVPPEAAPQRTATYHFAHTADAAVPGFPAISLHEVANVIIRPRSDTCLVDKKLLVADHFNAAEHMLYDMAHGHVTPWVSPWPSGLAAIVRDRVASYIKRGIVLTSYAVTNWSHFLSEVAPQVALVEHAGIATDIPLLVSSGLHPNMLEMINLLKAPQRPITFISNTTMVSHAMLLTPTATVPYDYLRSLTKQAPHIAATDCLFSTKALELMRERLSLANAGDDGSRIFIYRRNAIRGVLNAQEVADYFSAQGFHIVEPEKLSLREQMKVFSHASIIAGQSGAGLANMLFAPRGCRIIVMTLDSPFTIFPYFTNLAGALGHDIHYFGFTPIDNPLSHQGHADMRVDIATLDTHRALFS